MRRASRRGGGGGGARDDVGGGTATRGGPWQVRTGAAGRTARDVGARSTLATSCSFIPAYTPGTSLTAARYATRSVSTPNREQDPNAGNSRVAISSAKASRQQQRFLQFRSVVAIRLRPHSPALPLVSHFEHTPFSPRLCMTIKCKRDVIYKTGNT